MEITRRKRAISKTPLIRQPGFQLFLLALPLLTLVFLFSYLPLAGWAYAFFDYRAGLKLSDCEFVGFKYFGQIIASRVRMNDIVRVLRNTFAMSFLGILSSPLPMFFAIMLYTINCRPYRKAVQTLTTLPNFISWVLVYSVAYSMFSVSDGFVNRVLVAWGWIDSGINFLASKDNVWLTQWLWGTWKSLGWSAVMYMATLAGIDQELYEAARVDGACRRHIIWHIEVPGLLPTFFVLLMLSIGNIINNGMEQYYVFSNAMNKNYIEVLDLYVYNQGINGNQIPFATAVGMLKSIISITLVMLANRASKLIRGEGIM